MLQNIDSTNRFRRYRIIGLTLAPKPVAGVTIVEPHGHDFTYRMKNKNY